jgi:hypothetical protein
MVSDAKAEAGKVEYACMGSTFYLRAARGRFPATRDATFTAKYFRFIAKEIAFLVKSPSDKIAALPTLSTTNTNPIIHQSCTFYPPGSTPSASLPCDAPPHPQCSRH